VLFGSGIKERGFTSSAVLCPELLVQGTSDPSDRSPTPKKVQVETPSAMLGSCLMMDSLFIHNKALLVKAMTCRT
jgi:hypothetical protein